MLRQTLNACKSWSVTLRPKLWLKSPTSRRTSKRRTQRKRAMLRHLLETKSLPTRNYSKRCVPSKTSWPAWLTSLIRSSSRGTRPSSLTRRAFGTTFSPCWPLSRKTPNQPTSFASHLQIWKQTRRTSMRSEQNSKHRFRKWSQLLSSLQRQARSTQTWPRNYLICAVTYSLVLLIWTHRPWMWFHKKLTKMTSARSLTKKLTSLWWRLTWIRNLVLLSSIH